MWPKFMLPPIHADCAEGRSPKAPFCALWLYRRPIRQLRCRQSVHYFWPSATKTASWPPPVCRTEERLWSMWIAQWNCLTTTRMETTDTINPVEAIKAEVEKAMRAPDKLGLLSVRSANAWIEESQNTPMPKKYCHGLIVEGENIVLFARSNAALKRPTNSASPPNPSRPQTMSAVSPVSHPIQPTHRTV